MNNVKRSGPQNLLEFLPDIFTREEVQRLRQKMGVNKGPITKMISNWKSRGYIELYGEEMPQQEINKQCYRKSEKYIESISLQTTN
jgi:hypothetical protein